MRLLKTLILLLVLGIAFFAQATTYYCDPINGSSSNNGSASTPWGGLESLFNTNPVFNSGDVIICMNGDHGFPKINGVNTGYVTIQNAQGHNPSCTRVYFGSTGEASYWKLIGFTIESENTASSPQRLIDILDTNCNHISVQNCTIKSSSTTTSWTRNDWRTKACTGIWARGSNHLFQANTIQNVAVGIICDAETTLVNGNSIQYFTIDGIRGNASYCQYNQNYIADPIIVYTYAENHYDGFQSFTSTSIENVLFRRNTIIACTDTTRSFRGSMQGMGCFDGFYVNWTIENNLIITDHWHGITLLGATNCRIINNTVVDVYDVTPIISWDPQSQSSYGPAWIKIAAHKNGTPSSGNYVLNNLSDDMQNDSGIGTVSNNVVIGGSVYHNDYFVNALALDMHLIQSSNAIDSGTTLYAPSIDIEGNPRPSSLAIDAGAYEYQNCDAAVQAMISTNSICLGDSVVFSTTGNYDSLLWDGGWQNGDSVAVSSSGYQVVEAFKGGCKSKDSVLLTVNELPEITINWSDSVCLSDTIDLNNWLQSPIGGSFFGNDVNNALFVPNSGTGYYSLSYFFIDSNGCSNSDSSDVYVKDCALSIAENTGCYSMQLVNNVVRINSTNRVKEICIYNSFGQLVCRHSNSSEISLSNISKGVYIVKFQIDKNWYSEKIIH